MSQIDKPIGLETLKCYRNEENKFGLGAHYMNSASLNAKMARNFMFGVQNNKFLGFL